MQNIPIRTEPGSRMRDFFEAEEGNLLVDADYSQIELRVLAALANDSAMIEAFREGVDIHTRTAAQVFDLLLGDNLQGRKDHIAENGYKYLELADIS